MNAQPLNMLLVEDDEVDVMNIKRSIEKSHITNPVFVAGDGIEALEMLRSGSVPASRRLVLLDLNLPRMNGIEFLRELRKDPSLAPTPVIVLTTSKEDRDIIDAYKLNVAGYLVKPITFASFCDLMVTLNKYWMLVEVP
jgi:CheY-like chemotaxis protein